MHLREYLYVKNVTVTDLAKECDCHPGYLGQIKLLKKKPGRKLARDIEKFTNGEVTAKELLGLDKEEPKN